MSLSHRARRRIFQAGLMLMTATAVLAGAPLAANASLPPPDTTLIYHACAVMGSDGTTQAVHCADLISVPDVGTSSGGTDYLAENELLCQTIATGAIVECAGIHETASLTEAELRLPPEPQGVCGVRFGHDACGARRVINISSTPTDNTGGSETCHVWATSGVGSQTDSVVLPGSGLTVTAANVGTQHLPFPCAI